MELPLTSPLASVSWSLTEKILVDRYWHYWFRMSMILESLRHGNFIKRGVSSKLFLGLFRAVMHNCDICLQSNGSISTKFYLFKESNQATSSMECSVRRTIDHTMCARYRSGLMEPSQNRKSFRKFILALIHRHTPFNKINCGN